MSGKPAPELDALDLVVRARRAELGTGERGALTQALATSATTRVAYEVGLALDVVSRVRPGDEALLARALAGAFSTRRPIRRRRMPRIAAALAATLALASAAAATRQVLVWRSEARRTEPARVTVVEPTAANRTAPRGRSFPVARPEEASTARATAAKAANPPTSEPSSAVPVALLAPATTNRDGTPAPAPEATPASLFREAGAARRAGDLARARALYVELEGRFPGSNEARVSRVSLGKLFLSAGNAREADAAFGAYLRSSAADLREEALVGRADALMALGRSAEERSARQELLRSYPASVYANRARERIVEIDRADGTRQR
jgi:TolA-binding protein